MRLPKPSRLLFIALSVFLFSCSKQSDNNNGPTPITPVTPTYSTRLLKIYELDTTKPAPGDTLSRRFFGYDNANRLISDSFSSLARFPNTTYTAIRTVQYSSGSDTTAFQAIKKNYTAARFLSIDTTYYTFGNGQYLSDTVVYDYGTATPKGTSKTVYTYRPGVVIRSFQNWVPQNAYSAIERDTLYQTLVNGDILYQIDTARTFINGQFSGSQINETTVSYLPKPNPLYQLLRATAKKYITGLGIGNDPADQYAPAHLIAQQTNSVATEKIAYDYIFRADGYPLSATQTLERNGSKATTKLVFVYAPN